MNNITMIGMNAVMNDIKKHNRGKNSNFSLAQKGESKRYMPGLDGLRALSVLAVIAYHLNLKWAQGGLIGVDIFFVISGYLITDQIIQEWKKNDQFDIINFWVRRMRRLMPAMIAMLIFISVWLIMTDPSRLKVLSGDIVSSLFYANNWWLIFHEVSYFESFGPVSPIGHLWSLSIEEQFYLIWPIVLLLALKFLRHRGKLFLFIIACAAVSAVLMGVLYEPGMDPSRVYYGTDTRMFSLLIGAALAIVWPCKKLSRNVSAPARIVMDTVGFLGLGVLILLMYQMNEYDEMLYYGGFAIIALITAVVIAVLAHPNSILGKLMGSKPLTFLGVRSYSLYVWHFPVIILTTPKVITEGVSVSHTVLQLAASFILALLSYKYIEEPFRRGRSKKMQQIQYPIPRRKFQPAVLTALLVVILFSLTYNTTSSHSEPPSHIGKIDDSTSDINEQKNDKYEEKTPSKPLLDTDKQQSETPSKSIEDPNPTDDSPPVQSEGKNKEHHEVKSGKDITVIGDSIIVDVAPFLNKKLPGIIVDGKVGRQMHHVGEVIEGLKKDGKLGKTIIIELGNNGAFNKKQLRNVLDSLDESTQVLFVNIRSPKNWQDTVNKDLEKISNQYDFVTVVDWYSASKDIAEDFYEDGVHLKRNGAEFFAEMLMKALEELKQ